MCAKQTKQMADGCFRLVGPHQGCVCLASLGRAHIRSVLHSCKLIHLFSDGMKEEMIDKLRSILAQFEYQCLWDSKGVPFRTYLYVPETHPLTEKEFHEREDFAHVLKVNVQYM